MNIFFSVGEPSGDAHGARLIGELKGMRREVHCVGFGGPRMADAGCQLLHDMSPLALMFFLQVLLRLPTFLRLLRQATVYFRDHHVDAVVLIDYPGFNWCIARRAKRFGIPVFYYGAPQVWAWAPWRVRKLRRLVDYVLCQLPFEPAWYAERGCVASYVGHPFFDEQPIEPPGREFLPPNTSDSKLVVLLPGSRRSEVEANAVCFLQAAEIIRVRDPSISVAVASFNQEQAALVREQAEKMSVQVSVHVDSTSALIQRAFACVACSGSVSLQLLAARAPSVIYFRITRLQWLLKLCLMRVRYITLVNLLWTSDIRRQSWSTFDPDAPNSEPVPMPEYLTTSPCPAKIAAHVIRWIDEPETWQASVDRLDQLAQRQALPGATRKAAEFIFRTLESDVGQRQAA